MQSGECGVLNSELRNPHSALEKIKLHRNAVRKCIFEPVLQFRYPMIASALLPVSLRRIGSMHTTNKEGPSGLKVSVQKIFYFQTRTWQSFLYLLFLVEL